MYQTILDYLVSKGIKTDLETIIAICTHFGVKESDPIDGDFLKIVEYQFKNVADSEDLTTSSESHSTKPSGVDLLEVTQQQIQKRAIDESIQISGMISQYDQHVIDLVTQKLGAEKQNQTIAKQMSFQLMIANLGWSVRSHLNKPDHSWQEYLVIAIPFLLIICSILSMGSIDKPSTAPVINHDQNSIQTKITKA